MKIPTPKLKVGDRIHEIFYDDDINAWNVSSWKIGAVYIRFVSSHPDPEVLYLPKGFEHELGLATSEKSDCWYKHSLTAAEAAKKRNKKKV